MLGFWVRKIILGIIIIFLRHFMVKKFQFEFFFLQFSQNQPVPSNNLQVSGRRGPVSDQHLPGTVNHQQRDR